MSTYPPKKIPRPPREWHGSAAPSPRLPGSRGAGGMAAMPDEEHMFCAARAGQHPLGLISGEGLGCPCTRFRVVNLAHSHRARWQEERGLPCCRPSPREWGPVPASCCDAARCAAAPRSVSPTSPLLHQTLAFWLPANPLPALDAQLRGLSSNPVSPRCVLLGRSDSQAFEAAGKEPSLRPRSRYQQFSAATLWESRLTVRCRPGCGARLSTFSTPRAPL